MPISEKEWDAGETVDSQENRILSLLNKAPNKAFTASEIFTGIGKIMNLTSSVGMISGALSMWSVQTTLDQLVRQGRVEVRTIKERVGESVYYKIKSKTKGS